MITSLIKYVEVLAFSNLIVASTTLSVRLVKLIPITVNFALDPEDATSASTDPIAFSVAFLKNVAMFDHPKISTLKIDISCASATVIPELVPAADAQEVPSYISTLPSSVLNLINPVSGTIGL